MKMILTIIIAAGVAFGCSREPQIDVDAALAAADGESVGACPACPACLAPPPCPACGESDAIYYTLLVRVIHGEVESFITRGLVHRDGVWRELANLGPYGPETDGIGAGTAFSLGDRMLAQVRRDPRGTGTVMFEQVQYEQNGRVLISDTSAPIESVRGGVAHLISVFSAVR